MTTFIVYGPKGCGKTRDAKKIAYILCAKGVVDGWGGEPVRRGFVHLTNEEPPERVYGHKAAGFLAGYENVVCFAYEELDIPRDIDVPAQVLR